MQEIYEKLNFNCHGVRAAVHKDRDNLIKHGNVEISKMTYEFIFVEKFTLSGWKTAPGAARGRQLLAFDTLAADQYCSFRITAQSAAIFTPALLV